MNFGEVIPEHHLLRFKTETEWRKTVTKMGAWVFDSPDMPDGTLYAGTEDGTIGICLPNGEGTLLKPIAMRCNG
jgi:hypothetical protein